MPNKIVHIITRLDMGGSAQNTLITCSELSDKYDLVLIHGLSQESRMTDSERLSVERQKSEARRRGLKIIAVPALIRRIDPIRDLHAFIALLKLIRKEKPALVHTHSSKAGILGRMAARLAGVPIIVHTPHGNVFYGHFGPMASKLFLLIEIVFDRITDHVIALTEGEKNDYIKLAVSSAHKIHIIHSGIDVERFKPDRIDVAMQKRQLGLNARSLIVGTVGWLLPIKGPMYLLDAMMPIWQVNIDAILVYVGKGDLEEQLKGEAARRGIAGRTIFLGWRDDIHAIMQIFDIFVLPSLNEGMGRVLVEAMAAGKPVVASNVGGVPDLVKHKHNGFLVKPGDASGLSFYIKKLLMDAEMRSAMGRKGKAMAQDFSVTRMIEKIDKFYSLLSKSDML